MTDIKTTIEEKERELLIKQKTLELQEKERMLRNKQNKRKKPSIGGLILSVIVFLCMSALTVVIWGIFAFIPMVIVAGGITFWLANRDGNVTYPLYWAAIVLLQIVTLLLCVGFAIANPGGAIVVTLLIIIVFTSWGWSKRRMGLSKHKGCSNV